MPRSRHHSHSGSRARLIALIFCHLPSYPRRVASGLMSTRGRRWGQVAECASRHRAHHRGGAVDIGNWHHNPFAKLVRGVYVDTKPSGMTTVDVGERFAIVPAIGFNSMRRMAPSGRLPTREINATKPPSIAAFTASIFQLPQRLSNEYTGISRFASLICRQVPLKVAALIVARLRGWCAPARR